MKRLPFPNDMEFTFQLKSIKLSYPHGNIPDFQLKSVLVFALQGNASGLRREESRTVD